MSPIYGTGLFCLGLLVFFVMLHVVRRPDSLAWVKSRPVRELTVFVSMVLLVGGLGQVAHYATARDTVPLDIMEILVIGLA